MSETAQGPRGEIWKSEGHVDISRLIPALLALGFSLSRGHAKDSPSGGRLDTYQTMLVLDTDLVEYNEEQKAHNDATSFSEEESRAVMDTFFGFDGVGPHYKVTIFGNDPISRVPSHLYIKCGMPKPANTDSRAVDIEGGDVVLIDGDQRKAVTNGGVFRSFEMVRLSINVMPHHRHFIPKWLEKRTRHEREELRKSIGASTSRL